MVFHRENDGELWQPVKMTVFTRALQRNEEGGSAAIFPHLSGGQVNVRC